MLKNQLFTKYEIKSLNEKVDILLKHFERYEKTLNSESINDTLNNYSAMDCLFPIDNEPDMNSLNEQIELDPVYKKKLVN